MRIRLIALAFVAVALSGADWPRFRGPNGNGIVNDPAIPTMWGPDEMTKIPLPGRGNGSPVVSNGKLFLQAASDDGSERMLLCYEASTLKHVWTAKVGGGPGKTHAKNSLASSTPAADGQHIICLFWDGKQISLHGFDFTGKALWQVPLGGFTSQHGAGHSPVLHAGKVFLNNDQDGKAEFQCFNAATGQKLWSTKRQAFRTCYSSPYIRQINTDEYEVAIASTAGVSAYNPENGKLLWEWQWAFDVKPLRNVGSPVEGPGVIFAVSGDGDGSRHMVAVEPPGPNGGPPKLVWEKKRGTPYVPCPLVRGDHVYWVSDNGFAACVEAKTGKIIFDERFTAGVTASPILLNDHVLCIDERGNVFSFPATPKWAPPRKISLGENVYASPAAANGKLYIRGEKSLFVVGK